MANNFYANLWFASDWDIFLYLNLGVSSLFYSSCIKYSPWATTKFLWLKVSSILGPFCFLWGFWDLIGLRHASSLKKSLGKRREAAEEEILLVLEARYSGSRVWWRGGTSLFLILGAVGLRLFLSCLKSVGEGFLKRWSALILFFVTRIGMSACIN